ncbi:MAG: alpha/beta hydrolase [Anaerolineae bacterium]|nr:alpha/beta hydrolase [Anaerolineae bacterium]
MAGKNRFGTFMAMAAGAATAVAVVEHDRQKREAVARLQSGSLVAQTKTGQVEYAVVGEGPAVLVIHGVLGGYDQGLVISDPLVEAGFQVIAISRFGYLRTPPASNMSPEAQADQYAALLDELGIADVAVIGASGGGPSALQFAIRHPDRCRALVMMCAVSRSDVADPREASPLFGLLATIMRSDFLMWLAVTGVIKGQPLLSSLNPEAQQDVVDDPVRQNMFHAAIRSLFPVSLKQVGLDNDLVQIRTLADLPLEKISAPTLVLHGTADSLVPFAQAEYTASKIPGAQLIPIEGGEHLFFISHYDQVWPQVTVFAKKKPKKKTAKKKTTAKKTPTKKTSTKKKTS